MRIKTDLLKVFIADFVNNYIEAFDIDADKIADSVAIKMLAEIQDILATEGYSDFEIVEEIIEVFRKYKVDFGGCHDF